MEKSNLQIALENIRETGDQVFEIRSYSGRGMYGKQCLAIDGDNIDMFRLGLLLGSTTMNEADVDDLVHEADNMKQDSMGLGSVYYWPRVPYVQDGDQMQGDDDE